MRFDLSKAARKLICEVFKIKPNEEVVITYDTLSDLSVVQAVASEVFRTGAKPLLLCVPAPKGVGKAADPDLPLKTLSAALQNADVWIEFNQRWLLYSSAFEMAIKNKNLRYMCLVGMDHDMFVRTLDIDLDKLAIFMERLARILKEAEEVRIVNPSGTDVRFKNHPKRPIICDHGDASAPGIHMLPGQMSWTPIEETIHGRIVFDGSIVPPLGVLKQPVTLIVESGRIVQILGGNEAKQFESWLKSFHHEGMFRLAHISLGLNPGARLSGNVLEDERVWGCSEWGIGYISEDLTPDRVYTDQAPSHCDGVCLNSTIIVDGRVVMSDGAILDERLSEIMNG
ncbi:aminopeptidase [Pseudothermotoga sp.]|uniref:aminopeptidase n=1 Tax=Pseudothermotoga sp. TaxID=2033661 RepID=UPI0031F71066